MFKIMKLVILFYMLLNPSFKMMTSIPFNCIFLVRVFGKYSSGMFTKIIF